MKGPALKRFAAILVIFAIGCNNQATTPNSNALGEQGRDSAAEIDWQRSVDAQLSETTIGEIVLKPTTVMNGKLSLLIPEQFSVMDEEALKFKYPSEQRPTLAYTNNSGSVNIAINHTKNSLPQSEVEAFHKEMDGMFRNLYPSAKWFNSGLIVINGRNWLTLDLRTPGIDTEIRNIMAGTSVDGRLLLVSFNVTKELEEEWLVPAEAIIQSLRVEN